MDNRAKNITTLIEAINRSLDLMKQKFPAITEENYDKLKPWMQAIVMKWMEKPEQEIDEYIRQIISDTYNLLLHLECMYMVKDIRKGAHG